MREAFMFAVEEGDDQQPQSHKDQVEAGEPGNV